MKRSGSPVVGERFGLLTVVVLQRLHGKTYVRCRCDCGVTCRPRRDHLLRGATTSCGCQRRRLDGLSKTPEYKAWHGMFARCYDPRSQSYARYGGRGIRVTQRWHGPNGFRIFLSDVGRMPTPELTIERVDNNKNYTAKNVMWATRKTQARNRRSTRNITAFGKTQCLTAWAEETGLMRETIAYRLNKGISPEKALSNVVC